MPVKTYDSIPTEKDSMPLKHKMLKVARKLGCLGPLEQEDEARPPAIPPRSEPEDAEVLEPGRPYQAFVEDETRQYWQEMGRERNLTKPSQFEISRYGLPITLDAMESALERRRYAMAEIVAHQLRLEPGSVRPARPYKNYVEDETREYWQEIGKERNLAKPSRQDIRAAAMPILCQALRNRTGHRRHQAVAGMVQHAGEKGWIKWPFSQAHESPSYTDALIRLADDANWGAREIPLPDHPPPRHPPIYYTIGSINGRPVPVPREDAIIRGDYLYKMDGSRLTQEQYVFPKRELPGDKHRGFLDVAHTPLGRHLLDQIDRRFLDHNRPVYYGLTFERARKPINRRGVYIWFEWKEERGGESMYFSCRLRDLPYMRFLRFSPYPTAE